MDHMLKDLTHKMEGQPLTIYEQNLLNLCRKKTHTSRHVSLIYQFFSQDPSRPLRVTPESGDPPWATLQLESLAAKPIPLGVVQGKAMEQNRCKEWNSLVFRWYFTPLNLMYNYVTPVGCGGVSKDTYMCPTWGSFHYPLGRIKPCKSMVAFEGFPML